MARTPSPSTVTPLTFGSRSHITVAPGTQLLSNPVRLPVKEVEERQQLVLVVRDPLDDLLQGRQGKHPSRFPTSR
ncbi:hypothetical protein [Streptomyces sp. Ncost-T10-10d]|uniref:hypothetical protein n=1 Tax=Streptomyces sp. Ncost-T10-10d TaxID=1839774 RepID=UPI000B8707F3|nr:hypothetical protein [Streptomyces sp. Ncost-T10-10d]